MDSWDIPSGELTVCHGKWPSRNSGYFPIKNGGSFHGKMWLFTRPGKYLHLVHEVGSNLAPRRMIMGHQRGHSVEELCLVMLKIFQMPRLHRNTSSETSKYIK